jgi:transposase
MTRDDRINAAFILWMRGYNYSEIARLFKMSASTIRAWLKDK